jgi:pyruvate/2-oxoglutarate dehydrogenase complex dihydrolipoamide dehydrogenase (E3) component
MMRYSTDLCIIGAGSGGLVLASGAVQLGARVTLIEGALMGGDCLNYGCVPSKALLAAAKRVQMVRQGGPGLAGAEPTVDFPAVMARVHEAIADIAPHDSQERFEALGVRVLRAWARFTGPDIVEAGSETITARRFVIATGAHAIVPDLPGLDQVPYYTNETIFTLTALPQALVILGAGPVAVEMAQAFARLGAKVTMVARSRVMGQDDPQAVAVVTDRLRAEGVRILEGCHATAVTRNGGGVGVTLSDGSLLNASHLLIAMGRAPAIKRLNLAAAGVQVKDGGVVVDASLRTTNRKVFAIGDVAGGPQFTHLAAYQAGLVLRQAVLGLPARSKAVLPRVTYTEPELAQIGPTETEARAIHGAALTVLREDFSHMDRAITDQTTEGFIKLMIVKGRPVGATLVGAHAGEQISLWALALAGRVKLSTLAGMVAPYPTLSEISKRAAGAYFSPRLFGSSWIKTLVKVVQRLLA